MRSGPGWVAVYVVYSTGGASTFVPLALAVLWNAGVAEPLDETAEEVLLLDRLVGADAVQFRRPVCGHHDDRHARHARFDHRRKMIRRGGPRRAEHGDRLSGRRCDPEREKGRRPLVEMDVERDARMPGGGECDRRR